MLRRDDRPGWIVNLTNDGWFGISTGPYQHLQQARMRAIEQGLPLVRAANTGISAVIDPVGRIVAGLGLGVEGVLDANLPAAIPPTIYARIGDIPAAMLVALAAVSGRSADALPNGTPESTCSSATGNFDNRSPTVDRLHAPFAFCAGCKRSVGIAKFLRNVSRSSEQDLTVLAPEAFS